MTVVSNSSPLINLARIGCFDLLPKLYGRVYISREVYNEVAVDERDFRERPKWLKRLGSR